MTLIKCVAGHDWSCKCRLLLELKGLRFNNNGTHGEGCGLGYSLVPNIYFYTTASNELPQRFLTKHLVDISKYK